MPFAPKVNTFQAEVGRNQCLVTLGYFQHRRVIADSRHNTAPLHRLPANTSDQRFFWHRHGECQYRRKTNPLCAGIAVLLRATSLLGSFIYRTPAWSPRLFVRRKPAGKADPPG